MGASVSRGREGRDTFRVPARSRLRALLLAWAVLALVAGPVAAAEPVDGAASGNEKVKLLVAFERRPGDAEIGRLRAAGARIRDRFSLVPAVAIEVPERAAAAIRRQPGVAVVEPDGRIVALDHGPDTGDHEYENAWGVEHIGARVAHQAGVTGTGVKVAVIDTGIDYVHDDPDDNPYVVDPEFLSNYRGGIDIFNGDADPMDDNGHGTHVAGILAAEKNGYLVAGVAPGVDLYAVKILNAAGEGDYSHLIAGLEWAVANDMDVVNMSVGGHEVSQTLANAVAAAHAARVTMVAASGNVVDLIEMFLGCPVVYPAAYPQVLSTTFTNPSNALTGFSCTGPEVDVASPGDGVFSPVPVGTCQFCTEYGYNSLSGTSMASPHLAGLVALLLDAGLADAGSAGFLDDLRTTICGTADPGWGVQSGLGGSTPITPSDPRYANWFGCGVIDADEAVLSILPAGNRPPFAVDDTASTSAATPVTVDVLANDTDPDADALDVLTAGPAANGAAVVNADNTVTYTPNGGFSGTDTFSYTVSDGSLDDTGTVTVTVAPAPPPNQPPVANGDTASTAEDVAVSVAVLANDSDPDGGSVTLVGVTAAPSNGAATANADGTVTYVPSANWSGTDSFGYQISDGADTASATVSVTVAPADDPPAAASRSATTTAGTAVTITLTGTDVDTCELTFATFTLPASGVLGTLGNAACVANAAGGTDTATVVYTPNAGFTGTDSFTYQVADLTGPSAPATVTITVNPPAPPPSTHHVGDLDSSRTLGSKNWSATVTILVHSGGDAALPGAVVTGSWSGAATGSASCTTGSTGVCTLTKANLNNRKTSITFTVTSVTLAGSTYQPSANHDPDGESNGSSIVVLR
ncbi:MAG TPA: Ig-like domain-containing protein [Candidatus Limnocylindrales bacterium]|nr:Ig-like domain-containing protein [Candidatus Limnocylindrales bacterium]